MFLKLWHLLERNSIIKWHSSFFFCIVIDKNTSRAMSLGSVISTVFIWSNTADNDCRLCFPFIGYYCPLESRNAIILHHSGQVFFPMVVSSSIPYDTTMESLLFWMGSIAINHPSRVTEWLTQWQFGFWFCIMNYLSSETKKKKKGGIFSASWSKTNLPKLELFQNLCLRIALFAFCSSSIIVSV